MNQPFPACGRRPIRHTVLAGALLAALAPCAAGAATPGAVRSVALLDEVQEALDRFWPHLLKLFGRAESPRTLQYIKWGLRKTSNDELRQKFLNKTVPRLQVLGLKVPEPVRGDAALVEV